MRLNRESVPGTHQHHRTGQVWLPNAEVWANISAKPVTDSTAVPTKSSNYHNDSGVALKSDAGPSRMQAPGLTQGQQQAGSSQHAAAAGNASAAGPSERPSYTFFDLAQEPVNLPQELLSEVDLISDDDSQGGLPVCPICLGEIFDLRDKAVVISCMHVFCLACISRWSSLKKSCPLCKSRIQGYMYNILSETDYQERMLPPTPPRAKTPPSPAAPRVGGGVALIDQPRPSGGVRRDAGIAQRPLLPRHSGDRSSVFRRGRDQAEEFVPGMWPPVRAARSAEASTSSRQSLTEPRPYFYRVQAQAQSQVQGGPLLGRGGSRAMEGAASQEDAIEAWRRHIYVQGLRALPMDESAVAGAPRMSEERRAARLSTWIDRELRALLQTDDVAIVRAYVMGLVQGIGFSRSGEAGGPSSAPAQGSTAGSRGNEHTDAVAALRPFLQEHAEHFWHELKCFAALPLSMQTYDRLVKYSSPRRRSSPASVPSTESSSTAVLSERAAASRARAGGGAPRGEGEDPRWPERGDPRRERGRKRRRFSSRPPEEKSAAGLAASGRESGERYIDEPRDRERRGVSPEREWRRERPSHRVDRSERSSSERHDLRSSRAAQDDSPGSGDSPSERGKFEHRQRKAVLRDAPAGAVRPGRGERDGGLSAADRRACENELADLRSRALAALQTR